MSLEILSESSSGTQEVMNFRPEPSAVPFKLRCSWQELTGFRSILKQKITWF